MPHGADRQLPIPPQGALDPGEQSAFANERLPDLVSVAVEAADILVRQPYSDRRIEELPSDLKVAAKSEVEFAPELADEHRGTPLERQIEKSAIHHADPHATAQLVVVGESEPRDSAGGAAEHQIEGDRIPRAARPQPHGLVRLRAAAESAHPLEHKGVVERIAVGMAKAEQAAQGQPLRRVGTGDRYPRDSGRQRPGRGIRSPTGTAESGKDRIGGRRAARQEPLDVAVGEIQTGEAVHVRADEEVAPMQLRRRLLKEELHHPVRDQERRVSRDRIRRVLGRVHDDHALRPFGPGDRHGNVGREPAVGKNAAVARLGGRRAGAPPRWHAPPARDRPTSARRARGGPDRSRPRGREWEANRNRPGRGGSRAARRR